MRRTTILAIGTVTVGLAVGAAVMANSTDSPPRATVVEAAPAGDAKAQVGDPDDPATWVLPIQMYMPTSRQALTVTSSREELMDTCMSEAGFPEWKPSPDLPFLGGDNDMDARYGINDLDQAAKSGYHPDPDAQKAYDDAIDADVAGSATIDQQALLTCVQKINHMVPQVNTPELIDRIGGESWKEAQETPEVKAAFAHWSACMKGKGYTYAKPMDANDDSKWSTSEAGEASAKEKAVAVADVECRDKYAVEKAWFDAEAAIQQRDIKEHAADLDQLKTAMQEAVDRADQAR
ncbi:hypothetical protein [Streptomyces sp. NPDC057280]|uniref:hypothetical protein n=1 Tax=Streptomyces sp. NPDC057280 TaxID=3346081 RepID=UPI00362E94F5